MNMKVNINMYILNMSAILITIIGVNNNLLAADIFSEECLIMKSL